MTSDDTVSRNELIQATTELLREIGTGRAGRRRKGPFRPTLYSRVGGLVRQYCLDDAFLRALDSPGGQSRGREAAVRPKRKAPYAPPLFFLSTEREHRVTSAILTKAKNPFLEYANSPDEILLSAELFRRNPSLSPETLACHHFETLMPAEEDAGTV